MIIIFVSTIWTLTSAPQVSTIIKGFDCGKLIDRSLFSYFLCCVQLWITEKSSLLLSVEEVTNMKDLATVMILQRRLNSIQRDLGPLEDKVNFVNSLCRHTVSLPLSLYFLLNQLGDLFENGDNSVTSLEIICLILITCMIDYVMALSGENGN